MSSAGLESGRRGLRWWQWLLFALPAIVTIVVMWAVMAFWQAKDRESGFTWLSDYGRQHLWLGASVYAFTTGAVCCVVCGIVLGLTMRGHRRVLACIGWTLLGVLTNLPIAFAGVIFVVRSMVPQ